MFQECDKRLIEIRVSLARIVGQVELLLRGKRGELPEKNRDFLEQIRQGASRVIAYCCQLEERLEQEDANWQSAYGEFLHDSCPPLTFVHGYADLYLQNMTEKLTEVQRWTLEDVTCSWARANDCWNAMLKSLESLADDRTI